MAIKLSDIIDRLDATGPPAIELIRRAPAGHRLGVFAASFNPPTIAHIELIQRAAEAYSLDEILALAGKTNADKLDYECSLEDRLAMLTLAFTDRPNVSIGLSSHAFYVDMVDALERAYQPETYLHFIVGFDTFERVLDVEDQYTKRYYREFGTRSEAIEYLFARSTFIVASRAGESAHSVSELVNDEPAVPPDRVLYLDFPPDLGELSATDVRKLRSANRPIAGLVPVTIEKYIQEHGLYAK